MFGSDVIISVLLDPILMLPNYYPTGQLPRQKDSCYVVPTFLTMDCWYTNELTGTLGINVHKVLAAQIRRAVTRRPLHLDRTESIFADPTDGQGTWAPDDQPDIDLRRLQTLNEHR
ncbi:hypothetical protein FIE12Z_5538 [Fusarium flagelliforme]|uniref:Uncharacterized protein n=1 Tax=Fusarium flagelliforme TaxID=2675880 RepID=A0A395MQK8_9HYPO|nr:hypothetical protein FIE12Z_5538 [Fusarium flagelliforme]